MSLTVQSGIPTQFTVGDAISFKVTDSDFPATTWTSKILFKIGNDLPKSFDGAISGSDHLFALTNANTGTLVAGRNLVCLVFSDGTNRQSSDWVEVTVLPDPATALAKSFAQLQVDLLRVAIATLNASPRSSVNLNGQSFQRANITEYQKQLTYYESIVAREQSAASGLARNHTILPKFFRDDQFGPFPASTLTP